MNPALALLAASYGPVRPAAGLGGSAAGLSREQWIQTRHAAAVDDLVRRGMDSALAWYIAMALVAHWAHETGYGNAEWDFALGNIRADAAWTGRVHYLRGADDAAPAPYRAYDSLAEGVADAVRLAVDGPRYRPAFAALLASSETGPYTTAASGRTVSLPIDAVQWYADLTRAGWHAYSEESQAIYRSTLTRVAETVGSPPQSSPIVVAGSLAIGALAAAASLAWWRSAH